MHFSWVAIAELDPAAYESVQENDYLRVTQNPRFLKSIGMASPRAYRPWAIMPGIEVWQEVQRRINRESAATASGNSSVLRIKDSMSGMTHTYNFMVRLYRPNILVIEIDLRDNIESTLVDAFYVRQLSTHIGASIAVDTILGIIKSGVLQNYPRNNPFFARPIMYISFDGSASQFDAWKNQNKDLIANLLINNSHFEFADPALADIIFSKNKDVDIKFSAGAFSLISKQGIITAFISGNNEFSNEIRQQHLKRTRFLEFALAIREFITRFSTYRQIDEDIADFLLYISTPILRQESVLSKSVNGTFIWKILADELGLYNSIEDVDPTITNSAEQKFERFSRISLESLDSLDFSESVAFAMKGYRNNWLENSYDKHKALYWIFGALITVSGIVAKLIVK
jgi:hypothetical protein